MKILYIGDIMARPGRKVVGEVLPGLIKQRKPDLVIAQSENVSHGKGVSLQHFKELKKIGVDFFSGGNHSLKRPNSYHLFDDDDAPIIRPANMASSLAGKGDKVISSTKGLVLVVSILGTIFPEGIVETDNPLTTIDEILKKYEREDLAARIINFHGDLSSQKVIFGHYLDGRVSAVVGDHWHVPSADARVLPGGTAYISDVGMCGSLESSLGVEFATTIPNWREGRHVRHQLALARPYQFNAVEIQINKNGLAKSITSIRKIQS